MGTRKEIEHVLQTLAVHRRNDGSVVAGVVRFLRTRWVEMKSGGKETSRPHGWEGGGGSMNNRRVRMVQLVARKLPFEGTSRRAASCDA